MKRKLLTSLTLTLLVLFLLPSAAKAWDNVYLISELSSWNTDENYKFTKVDQNEFYYELPVSNITEGDFYFRYSVDPNESWGQPNWGPATDGYALTAADYPDASYNNSNAFKIAQSANATSCTIRLKYNNSTGTWTWHVTAEIVAPDLQKTDFTVMLNDPGWDEVYAFVWDGGTIAGDEAATWPGQKLTKSKNVYTFTYAAYSAPGNIIFNDGNSKQTPDLAVVANKTYTNIFSIVGGEKFLGSWDTASSIDMTQGDDGNWTLTIDEQFLSAGSFEYKAIYDHDWGIKEYPSNGNNYQAVGEDGNYKITFTLNTSDTKEPLTCILEKIEDVVISHTYTVVGENADLFGTPWVPDLTDNDMTENEKTGIYTWTKENVTLSAGIGYYKVVEDHSWKVNYGYSDNIDGNANYEILEDGIYTATFYFDPSKTDERERLYAEFTKTGESPTDHTYTVVGNSTDLFDVEWDPTNSANDMTKDEKTGIYTWTKENVAIQPNTTILYKVAQDHAWDVNYGYSGNTDGNADYLVSEGGIYTATFYFDPSKTDESERLYAEFTKTAELPVIMQDFTVTFVDPGWEEVYAYVWTTGAEPVVAWPGEKLTKSDDVYTYTINAAVAPEYIIFNNGDGNGKQTPDLTFENGKTYTHIYTIIGSTNGTKASADDPIFEKAWEIMYNPMTEQEDGTWTLTKTVELTEITSIRFKAAYNYDWDICYGKTDGSDQDYNDVQPGKYTVTFTFNPIAEGDKVTATFEEVIETQDFTVTFVDPGWEEVYAYVWTTGAEPVAAWPGEKLTKENDVYTYTINAAVAPEYIIFNNGDGNGKQTPDLTFENGKTYTHIYTIVGNSNGIEAGADDPIFEKAWEIMYNPMTEQEDGTWTLTKTVELTEPTSIQFKAAYNYDWNISYGKADGNDQNYNDVQPGKYTVTFTFNPTAEGDKVTATFEEITEAQDFTVYFDDPGWEEVYAYVWTGDTPVAPWPGEKLTKVTDDIYVYTVNAVIAPEHIIFNNGDGNGKQTPDLDFKADEKYTHIYTIVGSTNGTEASADDLIFGKAWETTIEANNLTEQADGTWKLTKTVELTEPTSIQFKAVYGYNWSMAYGKADGNNQDYNDVQPGKYTVTFTFNPAAEGDKVIATFDIDTRIDRAIEKEIQNGTATVYDLQGRRLNSIPQRGLYIVNGKTMVIK